jgi:ectoine hydroxylase-related dioxygenase (phytanoyl-CoA dioxygenase family)
MTGATVIATLFEHLVQDGYCIIPDLLPAAVLSSLEADLEPQFARCQFGDGYFYGHRTKRMGGLLKRSPATASLVLEPTILALAQAVLAPACERIQLNVAQGIEIHPGELEQFPHCDHDMWAGVKGQHEYLLNVMWPLTRFTEENGATRIYPGTHRRQVESLDELDDPVVAACAPGSAICFLGSTVHGAGANRSALPRRGVVIGYSLGWLKPYENLWLTYPPAVARTFSPELAELAGYVQHRPNLGNYEGQCPSILLRDDALETVRATDALRPDQEQAVRDYAERQRARE